MKHLIFALSLAFLVGLFAFSGTATHAYAFNNSSDQAQLTAHGSYRTVEWHRYWQDDRDFDGPYVRHHYDYYDPYYGYTYYYPYPYDYYYGPGLSINIPFFGINIP